MIKGVSIEDRQESSDDPFEENNQEESGRDKETPKSDEKSVYENKLGADATTPEKNA